MNDWTEVERREREWLEAAERKAARRRRQTVALVAGAMVAVAFLAGRRCPVCHLEA